MTRAELEAFIYRQLRVLAGARSEKERDFARIVIVAQIDAYVAAQEAERG